ncbi:MAG: sugar transferase [Candidatus Nealsonbacteria bacterium CG10_big_fil_rev_8_21_14_0_10_36_24]|uniref:Sugar transferase n=2 Tax=Candidatus Nealsoniibacteriota TaxID=1817911 RepID=A0A2H0YP63_9BACT|nr:MAG: sugar transferase [Candidatus Nealsonbacteria bacterium CG10_big_fil_rev_8_21_14_0_10_36_24]PIS40069.1 MAG: sugar transferase [Candidatus Nealsonbacteria bacterium CG08_land_8_20_14_0_20_36_22]
MRIQIFFKKFIDFSMALIGLISLAPVFVVLAVLIKLDSKGPVFFRQKRIGQNGKIFKIWKFRTMIKEAQSLGLRYEVAKNDPRITKIGKFLRRFGIDELPQFINVILGEMSLVGPRTALPHQVKRYSELEKRRFQVKPGIASLAHIKGWNALSWKERIKLDIWYIENWSIWLDFKILLKIGIIVLLGKGQYGKKGLVKDYDQK